MFNPGIKGRHSIQDNLRIILKKANSLYICIHTSMSVQINAGHEFLFLKIETLLSYSKIL